MDNRIITTDVMEEDFSLEGNLLPTDPGRVYWPGKNQKYLKNIY